MPRIPTKCKQLCKTKTNVVPLCGIKAERAFQRQHYQKCGRLLHCRRREKDNSLWVCGLAALCGRATVITALSPSFKPWETKRLAEWPYHLDPLPAEYSCKAHPCPAWTVSGGSPLPELPQPGFLHWRKPGRLANCDRPSCSHYTQSTVEKMTGMTRKQRGQQTQHVGSCFNRLHQDKEKGLLRTVRKEGMMTGGTHNCWRHIYWSPIRKPP